MALVALAEIGDRTQLLALVLASTYRKPLMVLGGVAAGALANHLLAAVFGYYLASILQARWFQVLIALALLGMAAWTFFQRDTEPEQSTITGSGAFVTSAGAIFLMEMGDKTQIATAALAAKYHDVALVAVGSSLGMLIAAAPAIFLGKVITRIAPLRALRAAGALLSLALGIASLAHALTA
jgi:putative Ca2+/H+ antiporter (TMEM165/GDT1 family)